MEILNEDLERERKEHVRGKLGMDENSYLTLMHLAQFAGYIFVGLGFVVPIVMWVMNSKNSTEVDRHGKNIANFMISMVIYYIVSIILILLVIGIPMLIIFGVLQTIFIIVAAIKANHGEFWKYPMAIPFFT